MLPMTFEQFPKLDSVLSRPGPQVILIWWLSWFLVHDMHATHQRPLSRGASSRSFDWLSNWLWQMMSTWKIQFWSGRCHLWLLTRSTNHTYWIILNRTDISSLVIFSFIWKSSIIHLHPHDSGAYSHTTAAHLDIGWLMAQQESWHARPTWTQHRRGKKHLVMKMISAYSIIYGDSWWFMVLYGVILIYFWWFEYVGDLWWL